jgi:hypothetical protein
VFNHLTQKFLESYIPEDHLSIDESLLLWKGRLGWNVYIPKKILHFGMKSCEAKIGIHMEYAWYMGRIQN